MSARIVIVVRSSGGPGHATSTPLHSAGLVDQIAGNVGGPDILANRVNMPDMASGSLGRR
jgi:hypothetical protein